MIVNFYLLTGYNWDRFLIENNVLGRPYCAVAAMGYCWTGNEKQFLVSCRIFRFRSNITTNLIHIGTF